METNFFKQVQELNITGDLQITIKQGSENTLVVSVLLNNDECTDKAKHSIPPLLLKGSAEDLDVGFFTEIAKPLEAVSGLMVNLQAVLVQVEEAKKLSAMAEKDKKSKDAKEKKYDELMEKIEQLKEKKKYREAYALISNPADFPDHEDELIELKEELREEFEPSLFKQNNCND